MAQTETYISEKEIAARFKIVQAYKPNFGAFYLLRCLYSITAAGGETWQRLAFFALFTFPFTAVAIVIDLACIAFAGVGKILFKVIEGLWLMAVSVVRAVFGTIVSNYLGTVLKIGAAVSAILLIYYNWSTLTLLFGDAKFRQCMFSKFVDFMQNMFI